MKPTVAEGRRHPRPKGKDWPGWSCGRAARTGVKSTKGGQGHARETRTQPLSPLSVNLRAPPVDQTQLTTRAPAVQSVGPQSSEQGQEEWAVGLSCICTHTFTAALFAAVKR